MKKIKYIFFGTPNFAKTVLSSLIEAGLPPLAVVTNPDRPFGRKKILTPPPVKLLAEANGIKVLQPEKINEASIQEIGALDPEFFVVAAYSKIIPKALIDIAQKGALGVHPSLLPLYRGASPIQSVILGGEKETGVAIYLMDEAVDHGPVLAEESIQIKKDETYSELQDRLADIGGKLIAKTLPEFSEGKILLKEQDHEKATFTKKFKTEDGFVSEEDLTKALSDEDQKAAEHVYRLIRALNPDPGVWTTKDGKRVKLLSAKLENGQLKLNLVQMEGKTPQSAKIYF